MISLQERVWTRKKERNLIHALKSLRRRITNRQIPDARSNNASDGKPTLKESVLATEQQTRLQPEGCCAHCLPLPESPGPLPRTPLVSSECALRICTHKPAVTTSRYTGSVRRFGPANSLQNPPQVLDRVALGRSVQANCAPFSEPRVTPKPLLPEGGATSSAARVTPPQPTPEGCCALFV